MTRITRHIIYAICNTDFCYSVYARPNRIYTGFHQPFCGYGRPDAEQWSHLCSGGCHGNDSGGTYFIYCTIRQEDKQVGKTGKKNFVSNETLIIPFTLGSRKRPDNRRARNRLFDYGSMSI